MTVCPALRRSGSPQRWAWVLIGGGELLFVSIATITVLVVLLIFPHLESVIDRSREAHSYRIVVSSVNIEKVDQIQQAIQSRDLHIYEHHQSKSRDTIIGTWHTMGSPENHDKFAVSMLKDKEIQEFMY